MSKLGVLDGTLSAVFSILGLRQPRNHAALLGSLRDGHVKARKVLSPPLTRLRQTRTGRLIGQMMSNGCTLNGTLKLL